MNVFLLICSSLQLTASRLFSVSLTVFESNQEMSLMESMAIHSHRPASQAEQTIIEPVVAFGFYTLLDTIQNVFCFVFFLTKQQFDSCGTFLGKHSY